MSQSSAWKRDSREGKSNRMLIDRHTWEGDLLTYGEGGNPKHKWGGSRFLNTKERPNSAHSPGAICVPAHHFREIDATGETVLSLSRKEAPETHNGRGKAERNGVANHAAVKLGIPSLGSSDRHYPHRVGGTVTEKFNPVRNIRDLVQEIQA